MGLRYRKSINLGGGFRINLSKNGIGYSWGVKGYRITKTTDGRTRQTVSIPGTGISYVSEHSRKGQSSSPQSQDVYSEYSNIETVRSSDPGMLQSSEYDELFKRVKTVQLLGIILFIAGILTISHPFFSILFFAGYLCVCIKGRCSILYEFDEDEQQRWDMVSGAWRAVADSESLQEIVLTAKSKNAKTTAGIENAVSTAKMKVLKRLPSWYLKTNVKPVVFNFQNMCIAIMPDRLLFFGKHKFGALPYDEVDINISAVGYNEGGKVPKDAQVVKTVWLYTNKDGSPDKRYANNKSFPVVKYGKIIITSHNGLNVQFLCSNEAASDRLHSILNSI